MLEKWFLRNLLGNVFDDVSTFVYLLEERERKIGYIITNCVDLVEYRKPSSSIPREKGLFSQTCFW
jgi:hypothetical protein